MINPEALLALQDADLAIQHLGARLEETKAELAAAQERERILAEALEAMTSAECPCCGGTHAAWQFAALESLTRAKAVK